MDLLAVMEKRRLAPLALDPEESLQAERMCMLLAEDRLTDRTIAVEVGIAYSTLALWKKRPEYRERIALYKGELAAHAWRAGIAQRENRLAALQHRWKAMHSLMAARAAEYEGDGEAVGGDTGLIVKEVKMTPKGDKIVTYAFDAALDKAIRETEKQAAIELGQWTEKRANLNVNVDAEAERSLTDEQHEAIRRFLTAPKAAEPAPDEDDDDR